MKWLIFIVSQFVHTDPADIVKDLTNAKAVVVDVSAPHVIIESFLDHFKVDSCPLILVTSDCGTNDRKKALALRIIEESGPTLITGKLGDIYAVAQSVIEKCMIYLYPSTKSL